MGPGGTPTARERAPTDSLTLVRHWTAFATRVRVTGQEGLADAVKKHFNWLQEADFKMTS
eukprot:9369171-Pyramimonas_sp.AAC.1